MTLFSAPCPRRALAAGIAAGAALLAGAAFGAEQPPAVPPPVTLTEGKRMVRMMDDIYKAAVVSTHKMYVQDPGTPAAVIWAKQVIARVRGKGWPDARIFATVERPLNPENHPVDDFERQAIQAFRAGKPSFEKLDGKVLRYATDIRILDQGCVKCHVRAKEGDLVGGVSYRLVVAPER